MVITKLIGGLGNQMFQYAAGRALSLHHATELRVDALLLEEDPGEAYTKRKFELDIFNTPIGQINKVHLAEFMHRYRGGINKITNRLFPARELKHYFTEKGPYFHPELFECSDQVYISGFWQCEKYFSKYADEIRKDFTIKKEFLEGTDDLLKLIREKNSVSLHVRRGDYVSNTVTSAFHGVCSPGYYAEAVKTIASSFPDIELFIFSDDLDWCKQNMNFAQPHYFVETGSPFKDLFLMQNCRHNIIANSSFSWWAAWLNPNPTKIVIAPRKWFADPAVQAPEIVPANWIKL